MDESDPYFFAYDDAIWYCKGRNGAGINFQVTEEIFAREYYEAFKKDIEVDLPSFFEGYIKALDCFLDIVGQT